MNRLRQARATRGWSLMRTAHELQSCAASRGFALPELKHLKTMLSRWENGHIKPGDTYAPLFCEIYGLTERDLGLPQPIEAIPRVDTDFLVRLATARSVGPDTAEIFLGQINEVREQDRQFGASTALSHLRTISSTIEDLLSHAVIPRARASLAGALTQACTLAGWQALDLGEIHHAWQQHEKAKAAAREANSHPALSYAMAEQACILIDLRQPADAVQLIHAAQQTGRGRVPPILESWLAAMAAEAHAAARHPDEARRSMDTAVQRLPDAVDDPLPYIFLDQVHLTRWRGNVLASLGDQDATEALFMALAAMDQTFIRATAGLECDIARALIAQGEGTTAAKHLRQARHLARKTGSVRQQRRINSLSAVA